MTATQRKSIQFLVLGLCVAALGWTVAALGPRRVWDAARGADPFWLGLAALAATPRFLVWAFKWRSMLRRRGAVSYGLTLRLILAGSFVNLTTPTAKLAGGIVRSALLARRRGWPPLDAYGWALADQVTNVVGQFLLFGILAVAAFAGLPPGPLRDGLLAAGAVVIAGTIAAGLLRGRALRWSTGPGVSSWLARRIPRRFRRPGSSDSLGDGLGRVLGPLLRSGGTGVAYSRDVLLGAAGFAWLCLSNILVLRALGAEAPAMVVSVAVMGGYFVGTVVGAWGGVGVTELALTGLFVQAGVPPELAATGALVHRAILYFWVIAGGGPALLAEARATRGAGKTRAASVRWSRETPVGYEGRSGGIDSGVARS